MEVRYTRFWIRFLHVALIFLQTTHLYMRHLQRVSANNLKREKVSKMSSEERVVCILKFMLTHSQGLFKHIHDEIWYCIKIIQTGQLNDVESFNRQLTESLKQTSKKQAGQEWVQALV